MLLERLLFQQWNNMSNYSAILRVCTCFHAFLSQRAATDLYKAKATLVLFSRWCNGTLLHCTNTKLYCVSPPIKYISVFLMEHKLSSHPMEYTKNFGYTRRRVFFRLLNSLVHRLFTKTIDK